MENSDPPTFINLTSINNNLYTFRESISKFLLKKYKVKIEDPTNFIYYQESSKSFIPIPDKYFKKLQLYS